MRIKEKIITMVPENRLHSLKGNGIIYTDKGENHG